MSILFNTAKLVSALVFAMLTLGSTASQAIGSSCPDHSAYPMNGCSLPGLVAGSFPYFTQSVNVTLSNKPPKNGDFSLGDFSLKASYAGGASGVSEFRVSNSIDDIYYIDNTFLQFKAKSKKGDVTGSIKIMGKIGDNPHQQTLMTADLTGMWNSSSDGKLIGFNTMNIQCGAAITAIVPCTSAEVIYLSLNDALNFAEKGKSETTGLAVTSVPAPATAWLFGSGLIGLAGMARRRRPA